MRCATHRARITSLPVASVLLLLLIASPLQIAVVAATAEPSFARAQQSVELAEALRLNNEVNRLGSAGRYDEAIPLAVRVLAILEKALGPKHPDVAVVLNSLAELYRAKGDYAKAEPLYQRSLAIREQALGPEHPDVATVLNDFAEMYRTRGEYAKAEALYQRALAIRERALGPGHSDVATVLNNLALLCHTKGDYAKAESLLKRALVIREQALGPGHPALVPVLNNLARVYGAKDDYGKAEPLYRRALAICEKALGPEHPDLPPVLNNLASLYQSKGEYAKAESLFKRALAIGEKTLGPEHPNVATNLNNLAALYHLEGEYAKAESLYQQALAIREKTLGPEHPSVAGTLSNLAVLYEAIGQTAKAIAFRSGANERRERTIIRNLVAGSERQKLFYLTSLGYESDQTISLHVITAPDNPVAIRLALLTTLRRKGRVLDATTDSFAALRRRLNPQDRALFEQLADARARLATLVLTGPGKADTKHHLLEIKRLEDEGDQLENEVSLRSAEFRSQLQPVTLEAVQNAIPPDAALIDFVLFRPYNAKANQYGAPRFAVYVLKHQGEPAWAELGDAAEIDKAVANLRVVLHKDRGKPLSDVERDVKPLARALDDKVMRPVRRLLGDTTRLLISPDGALNLIPFAALVDEKDRFLVENYTISYLTSGRDLLRFNEKIPSAPGVMVFANPDYGNKTTASQGRDLVQADTKSEGEQTVSGLLAGAYFPPLVGTAEEARALKAVMPAATILTAAQATEGALKQVAAPKILHIATHGFFLADIVINPTARSQRLLIYSGQPGVAVASPMKRDENPLLRSGLALAGANLGKSGNDNGVLTALEASGLNLWGTKLVVLSACDTGVGEIKNGQGVYGLRRALVLAGSETQVMSLWPVSDTGTRDLMIDYYKALQAGQGRSEALRQVQLRMLASDNRKHPYYWASFIQSGEWANLDGKR